MKNTKIFFLIPALIILLFVAKDLATKKRTSSNSNPPQQVSSQQKDQATGSQSYQISQNNITPADFSAPIDRIFERANRKPFGIFITSQNSPVQPERFQGYHTGTDLETFPEEQNIDVPVYAITDGKILLKKSASGYGGVLVENGTYNNSPITVIYGHMNLASIDKKVGDKLEKGEQIGALGKGYGPETDGERKHLHLGIHLGEGIDILGYVTDKKSLKSWIDPLVLLTSSDS